MGCSEPGARAEMHSWTHYKAVSRRTESASALGGMSADGWVGQTQPNQTDGVRLGGRW